MLTIGLLRSMMMEVVDSFAEDLKWRSEWDEALDHPMDDHYPAVVWRPITSSFALNPSGVATVRHSITMHFVDRTSSARNASERDAAHDRMSIAALLVWSRFASLYILDSSEVQGVRVSLRQDGPATLTPVWDSAGGHLTGLKLTVTVSCDEQFCATPFFPAS